MRRAWIIAGLAAVGFLSATTAWADVEVRAPFVRVRTGPAVEVRAPFARVIVPGDRAEAREPLPLPREAPTVPAWTLKEFAKTFKPAPGRHEIVFVHPRTCEPVKVCFELPNCCLREINCGRNRIEFDYGKVEVEIEFKKCGAVKVEYRD